MSMGTGEGGALFTFASTLAAMDESRDFSARLCESARTTLGADGASLTLDLNGGGRTTVVSTDAVTGRFEQLQDVASQGPSRDASSVGEITRASVEAGDLDRWPHLAVLMGKSRIRGTFWAVPLKPARLVVGVMTLHRKRGELSEDPRTVQFIADAVGSALLHEPPGSEVETVSEVEGWDERAQVYQASGMLVAQLGINPDDALALLRAHAYSADADLYQVATDVIEGRLDFSHHEEEL